MDKEKSCILVVDDTPENIDVLYGLLGNDYRLKVALNGKKAIELAKSDPKPDLVLLDILMPEMDGYEVCKILKESHETKDAGIIFQTSKNAPIDEQMAFELGASDFISKPFNAEVVKSRIKACISVLKEKKKLKKQIESLHRIGVLPDNEKQIEDLIALGETDKTEFKSTLRKNLFTNKNEARIENQCLKTVAGFLNSNGGYLFVGIDDNGYPLGLNADGFKNNDKFLLHWYNLLKDFIGADFLRFIESKILSYKGNQLLIVGCEPASKPVFFSRDDEEYFYVRIGNSTQSLKPSKMLSYIDDHFGEAR